MTQSKFPLRKHWFLLLWFLKRNCDGCLQKKTDQIKSQYHKKAEILCHDKDFGFLCFLLKMPLRFYPFLIYLVLGLAQRRKSIFFVGVKCLYWGNASSKASMYDFAVRVGKNSWYHWRIFSYKGRAFWNFVSQFVPRRRNCRRSKTMLSQIGKSGHKVASILLEKEHSTRPVWR